MLLDTLKLPDSLMWSDEFDWAPVAQSQDRAINGALIIQEADLSYGRPITLVGGIDGVWVPRSTIESLKELADVAAAVYVLALWDSRTFNVMFDRTSGAGYSAAMVNRYAYPDSEYTYYIDYINLITVA